MNNFLNDNRFYMVFKDSKGVSHKAYHVVNNELVKTPEYEAHLAQYAKHNYTSEDYKNGKRKPIMLNKEFRQAIAAIVAGIMILLVVGGPLSLLGGTIYNTMINPPQGSNACAHNNDAVCNRHN